MVRLRAIGECIFEVGAERLGPDAEMAFALLLVVTLAQGRPISRGQLVDLLWPATSEARARHNLRQTLYKLRQLGVPVESDGGQVRLPLEQLAPDILLHGNPDQPPSPSLLRPDEPFGEFLPGYAPELSEAFSAWLDEQRARMHARLRRAVLAVMLDERRRGNWGAVETLARKCLQLDPLNEEATLALAEATALTGSKRAALTILDGYLADLGGAGDVVPELRLPAAVLRRRIADRLRPPTSLAVAESYFVGRGESVALLHERFSDVRAGHGRAVLLWGEAGIGKSRVAAEFGQLAALEGARVERVVSQARDVERPLSLFMDLVPALLALPGGIGCAPESMAFLRRLTDHDPAVLEPSPATREAELLFAGVRQAILDLVDAVAHEAPLVLCVEDAHWLDGQSWRVLRELIDWIDERRVLLVLTSRQPHATASPPVRPSPQLELHRLPPLVQEHALSLFEAVTTGMEAPPMFRDWCVHVADGNPFFVRALAVHWIETGELRAPTSLSVLIDQRVARLTELPLRTLQACAVLGKTATFERLELVLGHKRHDLVESVDRLSEHGLVAVGGPGVPCRHDLIAQAALARLADPARRLLHRSAAEVLQAEIERSQSAALLWDCAQQWLAAGESERALTLVRSCAAHLLEVGLPAEAAEVYERALELCQTDAERLEMLEALSRASQLAGKWGKVLAVLQAHSEVEHTRLDDECTDLSLMKLEALWRTGHDIRGLLTEATAYTLEPSILLRYRARAAVLGLIFADNICDTHAVQLLYDAVMEMQPVAHDTTTGGHKRIASLIYHSSYGTLDEAVAIARHIVRMTSPEPEVSEWIRSISRASIPLRRAGHFTEAASAIREALELAEQRRYASAAASAADILATISIEQRRLSSATRWYQRALHWSQIQEGSAAVGSVGMLATKLSILQTAQQPSAPLSMPSLEDLLCDHHVRRRSESLALYLAQALQRSHPLDHRAVWGLLETLKLTSSHGGQDFPVEVVEKSLRRIGHPVEAEALLEQYVHHHRREQYKYEPVLLSVRPDESLGTHLS